MRVSRVDGGIPSLPAAPDGPETRPLLLASAPSIISRSLRGSIWMLLILTLLACEDYFGEPQDFFAESLTGVSCRLPSM
jgi:hypothetical protein